MRKERILTYPINVYFKVYEFWVHFDLFQNHQSNIKNIFNNHIQKCYLFLFIIDIFPSNLPFSAENRKSFFLVIS